MKNKVKYNTFPGNRNIKKIYKKVCTKSIQYSEALKIRNTGKYE